MFSGGNSSSNGSSSCCLSPGDTTGQIPERSVGIAVLGLACLILLLILLAFEIFYICRYKTTFLQRLFFYFTIAAAITEAAQVVFFGFTPKLDVNSYFSLFFLLIYAYFVELLLITSISVSLSDKMCTHRASRQAPEPNTEYILCFCAHKKSREAAFLVIVFIATLILSLVQITTNVILEFSLILFTGYVPIFLCFGVVFMTDLVLTVISIIAMIVWLCKLRRNLLPNKLKLVCREISLVVGFMATFLTVFTAFVLAWIFFNSYRITYQTGTLPLELLPFLHCFAPLIFFVYLCTNPRRPHRETPRQQNDITTTPTTAPPSTRVSLPTDTAAHAPNV